MALFYFLSNSILNISPIVKYSMLD